MALLRSLSALLFLPCLMRTKEWEFHACALCRICRRQHFHDVVRTWHTSCGTQIPDAQCLRKHSVGFLGAVQIPTFIRPSSLEKSSCIPAQRLTVLIPPRQNTRQCVSVVRIVLTRAHPGGWGENKLPEDVEVLPIVNRLDLFERNTSNRHRAP